MNIQDRLKVADSEKRIESIYTEELNKVLKKEGFQVKEAQNKHRTDGYVTADKDEVSIRILIETKFREKFKNTRTRSKALGQVVYYLKKFEEAGDELPNIIFIGDYNECFVVHANVLMDYLDKDYDWTIAPSEVLMENVELINELEFDDEVQKQCWVYEKGFDLKEVVEEIQQRASGTPDKVKITENNFERIFEYFSMNILDRYSSGKPKYEPREQVGLFMKLVQKNEDCYLHPNKKTMAVFDGEEIKVDRSMFKAFDDRHSFELSPQAKNKLSSIQDRIIEDGQRRMKGEFYTPKTWVDEAHKLIEENLGNDWKEKYMVWDCACGTQNLTRDYKFDDLYCSTLFQSDLDLAEGYSSGGTKFQYDFLNDDVEEFEKIRDKVDNGGQLVEADFHNTKLWKCAPGLIKGMLDGKELVFFINPPFGTATNHGATAKVDIGNSKVKPYMRAAGWSLLDQIYVQFLFRCHQMMLKNGTLCFFSTSNWITGPRAEKLRTELFKRFVFTDGMIFNASQFANVSDRWAVSFSILNKVI